MYKDDFYLFIQNLNSELQVLFDNYCAFLDKSLLAKLLWIFLPNLFYTYEYWTGCYLQENTKRGSR